MKKLVSFITTTLLLGSSLFIASSALAVPVDINQYTGQVADQSGFAPATQYSLSESIGRIIKAALSLTGVIFLVLTVYAGILWMTAQGNDEQVQKATGIVRTASMGLLVVVSCYGIVVFVLAGIGAATNSTANSVGVQSQGTSSGFWSNFGSNLKNSWWKAF